MTQKVTIIGAGNGAQAFAFDLAAHGVEVCLFEHPDLADRLGTISRKKTITAVEKTTVEGAEVPGAINGTASLSLVTCDPGEALGFSDYIFIIIPQFAHETMFRLLLPVVRKEHIVTIMPGNFGSLLFRRMLKEAGRNADMTFLETSSIPHAARIVGPAKVYILAKKKALQAAALPGKAMDAVLGEISPFFLTEIDPFDNVLEIGLGNPNMIMHVATAVLGMGPMESREGRIQFYREGCSESVSKVLEEEDRERLQVAAAYGFHLKPFIEVVNDFYGLSCRTIRDFAAHSPYHNNMPNDSPKNPSYRYITEDCPCGLVPVYSFGQIAGVDCPAIRSIITIAGMYNDVDYFTEGITPAYLGVDGLTKEELLSAVL